MANDGFHLSRIRLTATYCCTHQQADCDGAAVHLSKAALSFICPQGELMSRVWNALCTTIWTRTPHQYKRLEPSTAWANSSSIYSDHYSKNPSTTAANDIFHYASVGGGTEFLMDVILLVNTLQTLTIQWHPTKILRQMSQCLIVSLGSRCQRKWTQHSGDGEARSLGLRCDIALWLHLTGFLSSVRNTGGSPMRPHENFDVKLKGVSYVKKNKNKNREI